LIDGWLHTAMPVISSPTAISSCSAASAKWCITADGERYIPNYIENRIKFSPYVRNVACSRWPPGPDGERLHRSGGVGHWAEERGHLVPSYADLSQKPEVSDLIASVLCHVNDLLLEPLRVRRFVNLHKDFDADDGEITRTRKLRRMSSRSAMRR